MSPDNWRLEIVNIYINLCYFGNWLVLNCSRKPSGDISCSDSVTAGYWRTQGWPVIAIGFDAAARVLIIDGEPCAGTLLGEAGEQMAWSERR